MEKNTTRSASAMGKRLRDKPAKSVMDSTGRPARFMDKISANAPRFMTT